MAIAGVVTLAISIGLFISYNNNDNYITLSEQSVDSWSQQYENSNSDGNDTYVVNTYVTFETGAWIFAAELNYGETQRGGQVGALNPSFIGSEPEVLSGLLMANFAYSDVASVTGRLSYAEIDDDNGNEVEFIKLTLAHGYAFTDNLLLVTELSFADIEEDNGNDTDELAAAVELLFTF